MLNILEGYDLGAMGHNSSAYLHVLTESMRRAYADRAEHLGDPDFNEAMPIARLMDKDYAAKQRATIDMAKADISDPSKFAEPYESEETTHFSVVDKDGNMVSMTYTLEFGYGSAIVVAGGGYLLNNEMGDFNAMPGMTNARGAIGTAPNLVAPQKRMLSSMTPTIVAKDGKPVFTAGSPGGKTIINTTMQLILNVIDHDMNIAESVEAGRIHHQWLPDVTSIEDRAVSADSLLMYEALGHPVRVVVHKVPLWRFTTIAKRAYSRRVGLAARRWRGRRLLRLILPGDKPAPDSHRPALDRTAHRGSGLRYRGPLGRRNAAM
jgi:gamma-glutamyltranspeptidase/glutathione hydrolase